MSQPVLRSGSPAAIDAANTAALEAAWTVLEPPGAWRSEFVPTGRRCEHDRQVLVCDHRERLAAALVKARPLVEIETLGAGGTADSDVRTGSSQMAWSCLPAYPATRFVDAAAAGDSCTGGADLEPLSKECGVDSEGRSLNRMSVRPSGLGRPSRR